MTTPARPAAPARGVGRHRPRKSSNPAGYGLGQAPPPPPPPPVNVARRGSPEILLPPTGAPIAITSPAVGSTFSAWTNIATPANDLFLSQLYAILVATPAAYVDCLVEFGYGAAPAAIDAVKLASSQNDPTADVAGAYPLSKLAQPAKVPAGQMLKARVWNTNPSIPYELAALGYDSAYPVWDELPSSLVAGAGRYYDSHTGLGIAITTGLFGTWGATAQVIASAPNDLLVVGLDQRSTANNINTVCWIVQVGYGPAGSEVWCSTHIMGRMVAPLPIIPPVWVKAGERVALRAQGTNTTIKRLFVKVYDL